MATSSYTEKEIKQLVRDAVKAALKDQKDAHDEVIQKLVMIKRRATRHYRGQI